MKSDSRNTALDIIRLTALFFVICVHFFLKNGFYSLEVSGGAMYALTVLRCAFMMCVPLFIMLTGYLMSKKTLQAKYYCGLIKTVSVYVIACLICIAFKAVYMHSQYTLGDIIFGITGFTAANYSWYVEMYIGLFLIIPFLNLIYNNLNSKKHKQALVLTFLALTALPGLINSFRFFDAVWWLNPRSSFDYNKILPDFFVILYPISYYFIGCYLNEFKLKIKRPLNILLLLCSILLFGTFCFYRSRGGTFIKGEYQTYSALPVVAISVLTFILLNGISFDKIPPKLRSLLAAASDLTFGAYLLSYIFERPIYDYLDAVAPGLNKFYYMPAVVIIVFVCALMLSWPVNKLYLLARRGLCALFTTKKRDASA